jgi:protoporphyrinogen oxidase
MLPKGQTVLCFEISCFSGDEVWSATDEELLRIVQGDLDQLGLVKREEIADCFTGALERAYPVYDLGFEERIMGTLKGLSRFENLLMIGRHGLYMNNSMDDNVLLGINVAEFIDRRGALSREWLEEAKKYMVLRYEGK